MSCEHISGYKIDNLSQSAIAEIAIKKDKFFDCDINNLDSKTFYAWNSNRKEDERLTAVEKLVEQSQLARVAINAVNTIVRLKAFEKLTEQSILLKVAINTKDIDIQRLACEKISDQDLMSELAISPLPASYRRLAVCKLNSQAILCEVATHDPKNEIRDIALEKLSDEGFLAKVAMDAPIDDVAARAIFKINSPEVLAEIALSCCHSNRQLIAYNKISDLDIKEKTGLLVPEVKYAAEKLERIEKAKEYALIERQQKRQEAELKRQHKEKAELKRIAECIKGRLELCYYCKEFFRTASLDVGKPKCQKCRSKKA